MLHASSVSVSCGCMDMWLIFLALILLTRFSQRGSLMSGGGQWADHVPRGCSRLTGISRRWGWAWHLPGGRPDGGPWSTGGKWTQRRAVLAHAPIPDLVSPAMRLSLWASHSITAAWSVVFLSSTVSSPASPPCSLCDLSPPHFRRALKVRQQPPSGKTTKITNHCSPSLFHSSFFPPLE